MSDVASPVERREDGGGGEERSAVRPSDRQRFVDRSNERRSVSDGRAAEEPMVEGAGRRTVMTAEETAQ